MKLEFCEVRRGKKKNWKRGEGGHMGSAFIVWEFLMSMVGK